MKALLFIVVFGIANLKAADLASQLAELGPAKEVIVEGNVILNNPARDNRELKYKTEDSSKIAAMIKWIRQIPCEEALYRFHGKMPALGSPEAIEFRFIGRDGTEHSVGIVRKQLIIVDIDRAFLTHGWVRIDFRPLFEIMKDLKMDSNKTGK